MAVGVHLFCRPSTARTATVVQREYGLKVDRLTAENMRLDSVLISGKGSGGFCLAVEWRKGVHTRARKVEFRAAFSFILNPTNSYVRTYAHLFFNSEIIEKIIIYICR